MGKVCPIILIFIGGFILLLFGILTVSFNGILKSAVPYGMNKIPLNQILRVWPAIPVPLSIKVNLTAATTSKENFGKTTLAKGHLEFLIETSNSEYWDPEEFYPVLWVQEDGELGELNRAVQVYSEGQINWTKAYGIGIGLGTCGFALAAVIIGIIIPRK